MDYLIFGREPETKSDREPSPVTFSTQPLRLSVLHAVIQKFSDHDAHITANHFKEQSYLGILKSAVAAIIQVRITDSGKL